jgi:hypothetical protein
MTELKKTYGEISSYAYLKKMNPDMLDEEFEAQWKALPPLAKASEEAGAQAVLKEFCDRHRIKLHIGETLEDMGARLVEWAEREDAVSEIHITIPPEEKLNAICEG